MPPNTDDEVLPRDDGEPCENIDGDGESVLLSTSTRQGTMTCPRQEEVGTSTTRHTSTTDTDDAGAVLDGDTRTDAQEGAGYREEDEDGRNSSSHAPLSTACTETGEEHAPPADSQHGANTHAHASGDNGSTISSYTNIDHFGIAAPGGAAAASLVSGTSTSSGSSWLSRQFADLNTEATPPGTRTRSAIIARPAVRGPAHGSARGTTNVRNSPSADASSSNGSRKDALHVCKDGIAKAKEDQELHAAEGASVSTDDKQQHITTGSDGSSNEATARARGEDSTILSLSSIISSISAPASASEGPSTIISSLTSSTFHTSSTHGDNDGLARRSRSRSRSRDLLPTIASDSDDGGEGDGEGNNSEDESDANREMAAIRRSIRETPGAYHVRPVYVGREDDTFDEADTDTLDNSSGNNNSESGNGSSSNNNHSTSVESGQEQAPGSENIPPRRQRRRSSRRSNPSSSRATLSTDSSWDNLSIELAEAWVVEEEDGQGGGGGAGAAPPNRLAHTNGLTSDSSSASPDIEANVEPAIVTITATPVKERRWFKTPAGILLLILLLGGIVALAVVIPATKKSGAEPRRPFEIVVPTMPQDVSNMLEFKYNKVVEGQPIPMAFSADLSLHTASRIDEWYGQLLVVRYNANLTSWEVVAKYDAEEARKDEFKNDVQHGNSPGDNFGAWVDMSYDGRILAVGLPRDDPLNIPDAGSVRVMEMGITSEGGDLNGNGGAPHQWNLKGRGDFITGEDPFGWTGSTFSLTADGSMIAVASPIASKSRGNIMVYKFKPDDANFSGGEWTQIGQVITGDEFGSALAFAKLSEDGSILGAGSFLNGDEQSGKLRIFRWDGATKLWAQIGSAIEGNDKARLGVFPHFSRDGLTVAFSQTGDPNRCHVYQWDEVDKDWTRIDDEQVFPDSYICMDLSPDGKKVILCSTDEQRCILNLLQSGGEWHEVETFPKVYGFMPYHFEREGEGDTIAGIVAPIGKEKGYTIGFYNII